MKSSKNILKLIDDKGKEYEYRILFTMSYNEGEKNYIAFTNNSTDAAGNIKVNVAIYDSKDPKKLNPIEDEKELSLINSIFKSIQKKVEGENK